jgi:hypothetical protein
MHVRLSDELIAIVRAYAEKLKATDPLARDVSASQALEALAREGARALAPAP